MGYFNYFVRCLIRRFVRCFFNRKTFIFLFIIGIVIFLSLYNFAYGVENILLVPSTIYLERDALNHFYAQDSDISTGGSKSRYAYYYFTTGTTYIIEGNSSVSVPNAYVLPTLPGGTNESYDISGQAVVPINKYSSFVSGFDGYVLLPYSDSANVKVYQAGSDAIDSLRDAIVGSPEEFPLKTSQFTRVATPLIVDGASKTFIAGSQTVYYFELPDYNTYNYTINFKSTSTSLITTMIGVCDEIPAVGVNYGSLRITDLSASNNFTFTGSFTSLGHKYLYLRINGTISWELDVSRVSKSNLGSIGDNILSSAQETQQSIQDSAAATQNTIKDSALATQNTIKESSQQMQNTITDSSVDVSTDLPKDTTQDITATGFDNLFGSIRNTFTTGRAQDLKVTIPFTNKSFTINSSNVYNGLEFGIVGNLINTFWWFCVSSYIVHDIYKKINAIKSGNIDSIENTNIKESML